MGLKEYFFGARREDITDQTAPVAGSKPELKVVSADDDEEVTDQVSELVAVPVITEKKVILPSHIFSTPPMESWRAQMNAEMRGIFASSRQRKSKDPLAGRSVHHRLAMVNELITDAQQFGEERLVTAEEEGRAGIHILTDNVDTIPFDRETIERLQQATRTSAVQLLIVGDDDPQGLWHQAAGAIPGIEVEQFVPENIDLKIGSFIVATPRSYMNTEAVPLVQRKRVDYERDVASRLEFNSSNGVDSLMRYFSSVWSAAKEQRMRREGKQISQE